MVGHRVVDTFSLYEGGLVEGYLGGEFIMILLHVEDFILHHGAQGLRVVDVGG